jgi:hypothetical protein
MTHQLVNRESISYSAARGHIAKALRVLRGEFVKSRGGKREGSGRPKDSL